MSGWRHEPSPAANADAPTLSDLAAASEGGTAAAQRPMRIALVAGETSGDALGAGLIEQLRRRFPDAEFAGIGGDAMRGAGCETWHDAGELAVMGLSEVLRHLPRLLRARHGVDARFVGHPMADEMPLEPDQAGARVALDLPGPAPVLAVLPGSRLGEIERLGRIFLEAARLVSESVPDLRLVVPAANAACRDALQPMLAGAGFPHPPRLLDGRAREAMVAADVVLLASGTATLEAMLAKRAMVVGYRVAPLTYRIVKAFGLLKVERYALPNVLAGSDVAPELMQDECTPQNLAAAVLN
ncbi:MAG: hypothetical protein EOP91_12495, partial [Lysobacteraceae bacterium]